MNSAITKIALSFASSLLIPAIVCASGSDVLWDQSVLDVKGPGIANSYSAGFGGFIIHSVNDVTVDGDGWHVDTITQYYSTWNPNWAGVITTGYLHISPKTGPLPTFDPTTDTQIPMSAAYVDANVLAVVATGVNIDLAPGDYWIGITPVAQAGIFGANLQWPTALVGDAVASHELGAWHNYYAGWDGAILVEGDRPVSVDANSWGSIKSLYR